MVRRGIPAGPPAAAPVVAPVAWRPVSAALATLAVVLTVTSNGYGYHRDELYFRMLPPAWGYVDQPPLTPLLAHGMAALVDQPWAVRVPATLAAVGTTLVVVLLVRELGGTRRAQTLAAWGFAFAALPLSFSHILFTSTLDDLAWAALLLCVVRARLRPDPRWWVGAGAVTGLATTNKLLVGLLLVCLSAAVLLTGPRGRPGRWFFVGVGVAAALALPTFLFQVTNGWPQLTMARSLAARHASDTRILLWPMLFVLLGPFLVPVWVSGMVALWRRPEWRPVRFLAPAFLLVLVVTAVTGGQFYYPLGLLPVLFAAGCVVAAEWLARGRADVRRRVLTGAVAVNATVSSVIALPLLPVSLAAPVAAVNQAARDQIGWPTYVDQVAHVVDGLAPAERAGLVLVTTNYGEAGAVDRYGPGLGLPAPVSGHNELWLRSHPPDTRSTAVVVGKGATAIAGRFATCTTAATLDNGVSVANEEQGQPISVCRNPRLSWSQVWGDFRHTD